MRLSSNDLPLFDGSLQDCLEKTGYIRLEGSKKAECECAYNMSNCPNHPEYDRIAQQHKDIVIMEERTRS